MFTYYLLTKSSDPPGSLRPSWPEGPKVRGWGLLLLCELCEADNSRQSSVEALAETEDAEDAGDARR